MREELTTFMLTSITGIAKEKRKSGTDSETVTEKTKCLLNTTGIEPLCGELSEIQSRSFVIDFDIANQGKNKSNCFIESEVIAAIQRNRDLIISALMKRTSEVLAMMRDGKRKQVMMLLNSEIKDHDKRRCNEYLSLMYLMMLAGSSKEKIEASMVSLSDDFKQQIESINNNSREIAQESNQIVTALYVLFNAYRIAVEQDAQAFSRGNYLASFIERYQVQFEGENRLKPISTGALLTALKRVSREFGLEFSYSNPAQLGRRISNDLQIIKDAGFLIERVRNSHTKNYEYLISRYYKE